MEIVSIPNFNEFTLNIDLTSMYEEDEIEISNEDLIRKGYEFIKFINEDSNIDDLLKEHFKEYHAEYKETTDFFRFLERTSPEIEISSKEKPPSFLNCRINTKRIVFRFSKGLGVKILGSLVSEEIEDNRVIELALNFIKILEPSLINFLTYLSGLFHTKPSVKIKTRVEFDIENYIESTLDFSGLMEKCFKSLNPDVRVQKTVFDYNDFSYNLTGEDSESERFFKRVSEIIISGEKEINFNDEKISDFLLSFIDESRENFRTLIETES